MPHEKLCVFCKHSSFNTSGCHGEYPDPAYFECDLDLLPICAEIDYDMTSFRKVILTAQTCEKYTEAK